MAKPPHRVQVNKQESAALGGSADDDFPFDAPIEPEEDALEAAGYYVQASGLRDETTLIWRDGNDMMFEDTTVGSGVSLYQLLTGTGSGGAGLTEAQHKALRHLIHFMDEGPGDGFTTTASKGITDQPFPTQITWYADAAQTQRLFRKVITRSGGGATKVKPTPILYEIYDSDGSTVLITAQDDVTYSGVYEAGRTRTFY